MDFISLNHPNANAGTGAAADTSKILKALADMAKTNTQAAGMPSQANTSNVPNLQNAYLQNMPSSVNSTPSVPPATQAVNVPGAMNGANPFAGLMSSVPNFAQNIGQTMPSGQTNMQANPTVPTGPTPAALQQQVQLLSMLQAQGVPQDQWAPLLQVLMQAGAAGGAPNAAAQSGYGGYGRDDPSRDRNGYNDQYNMRSPQADIETVLVLVLLEAMVDVVIALLVVVIVPPMATMVAGVRGVKVKAEAEIIVNEAHRTAIVRVIVPDAKSKHCLLQVQSASSMTMLFRLTTLRVGRMRFLQQTKLMLTIEPVLSRTLFVGGVT